MLDLQRKITPNGGKSMSIRKRRSREEIIDLFRTCQATLGKTPGIAVFCKLTGVKRSEVDYFWTRPSKLTLEAGGNPNKFASRLPDEEVFQEYARVCQH